MQKEVIMTTKMGVQCVKCGTRLFSFYRHDYKICQCKNETSVDGGDDYIKIGWKDEYPINISWVNELDGGPYIPIKIKDRWPY